MTSEFVLPITLKYNVDTEGDITPSKDYTAISIRADKPVSGTIENDAPLTDGKNYSLWCYMSFSA
eukprot:Awhi_evm1s7025